MVTGEPRIEVIIPNWNGEEMLAHCLSSLQAQTFRDFSITVVDNGSTDGSVPLLQREYPEVKIIALDHNTGFSSAVNQGIEQATAPWLLLLNNDMEVAPDCLANLQRGTTRYEDCDFFALKMMNFHQRDVIDGAGDAVLRGGVGYRLGTLEKDTALYQQDRETFGACAGAALYSKTFFDRTGLFDPDFFAYLEDVDLNIRARRLGLRCMFLASAVVYHIGSATSGSKINSLTVRLSTRNNAYVLIKNYSAPMFLRFLPAITVYQCAWALFCLKHGMIGPWAAGLFQAMLGLPRFYRKKEDRGRDGATPGMQQLAELIKEAEREAINSIMARRSSEGKNNELLLWYGRIFL